jgi:hypothetical protein
MVRFTHPSEVGILKDASTASNESNRSPRRDGPVHQFVLVINLHEVGLLNISRPNQSELISPTVRFKCYRKHVEANIDSNGRVEQKSYCITVLIGGCNEQW